MDEENKKTSKLLGRLLGGFLFVIVGIPTILFVFFILVDILVEDDEFDPIDNSTLIGGSSNFSEEATFTLRDGSDYAVTVSGNFSPINYDNTQVFTNDDVEWVMYWYLCGSDLETYYGSATDDLFEMMEIDLPENVQVVIQTGGANEWQNQFVDSKKIQRYLYSHEGLELLEEHSDANMGEVDTLADFLIFAKENYPAKNVIFNFWNHGGGSVSGVAFDENHQNDPLTLPEMYHAFTSVYQENPEDPPFAIIGFDACLMATIDTAYVFSDLAEYMVASEELEPGTGWDYSGFLGDIAKNPQMSPLDVGISICDSYYSACDYYDWADDITLSVVNLGKLDQLLQVYEEYGLEALEIASQSSGFFTQFAQAAQSAENYGGNNRREGYTNMVDLGHLARMTANFIPETSSELAYAIDYCVEYRVSGPLRSDSYGLSTYYYYDGDHDTFYEYVDFGPSPSVKYLYDYGLSGSLSSEGLSYLNLALSSSVESDPSDQSGAPEITTTQTYNATALQYEDCEATIDDDGNANIYLGSEAYDVLSTVGFEIYYVDYEKDILLCLGYDNDLIGDWDNCHFTDNFRGAWGSLDGNLCYMELSYEANTYNDYAVPILLNGESYNLEVVYDFTMEEYYIKGARKSVDESGKADKNLRKLVIGDVVDIVHLTADLSSDGDDLYEEIVATITVDRNTSFYETSLQEGTYMMCFALSDYHGNMAYSEVVAFDIDRRGDIYTYLP